MNFYNKHTRTKKKWTEKFVKFRNPLKWVNFVSPYNWCAQNFQLCYCKHTVSYVHAVTEPNHPNDLNQHNLICFLLQNFKCDLILIWMDFCSDPFVEIFGASHLLVDPLEVLTSVTFLRLIRATTALKSQTFKTFPNGNFIFSIVTPVCHPHIANSEIV